MCGWVVLVLLMGWLVGKEEKRRQVQVGCVTVLDDEALLSSPVAPLWWTLARKQCKT